MVSSQQQDHAIVVGWIEALQRQEGAKDPAAAVAWARFLRYHQKHSDIWPLFVRFTFQVIQAGQKHYGAHAIFQRIRWHAEVEQRGKFKISNTAFPYYARVFAHAYPKHKDFFRFQDKPLTGLAGMD